MKPFKYNPPRVGSGDLRTPITFYRMIPKSGPEPGAESMEILFQTWAKIDHVWLKDLELAKANKTISDVTITIRNPIGTFFPNNRDFISINTPGYEEKIYNVKHVQNDFPNTQFMTIVGGLIEWE